GHAGTASVRPRSRGDRRARCGRPSQDQGVRGAEGGRLGGRGGASALRQGSPRPVQIPALDRIHRRIAEDRDRKDPALPLAGAGGGRATPFSRSGEGPGMRAEADRLVATPEPGRTNDARETLTAVPLVRALKPVSIPSSRGSAPSCKSLFDSRREPSPLPLSQRERGFAPPD